MCIVLEFLGSTAPFIIDVNFLIQLVTFFLVIIGILFKIKKKFTFHGFLMGIVVFIHLIFFAVAMWPSFSIGFEFFSTSITLLGVQAMWIHAIPGLFAMIFGLFIFLQWILRISDISKCFKRKRLMDFTLVLWFVSLFFGIIIYFGFYF